MKFLSLNGNAVIMSFFMMAQKHYDLRFWSFCSRYLKPERLGVTKSRACTAMSPRPSLEHVLFNGARTNAYRVQDGHGRFYLRPRFGLPERADEQF
jgi:hypothetical protein